MDDIYALEAAFRLIIIAFNRASTDFCVNGCLIVGKDCFHFGVFADGRVQAFDGINCVNDLPDFQGEVKEGSELFPVLTPGSNGVGIFGAPFTGKLFQCIQCHLLVNGRVNSLKVRHESLAFFPDHIPRTIADLVHNTQLADGLWEGSPDCLPDPGQVIGTGD